MKGFVGKHLKIKNIWEIAGFSDHSTEPVSMLYTGANINRSYFARILFGDRYKEKNVGALWPWQFLNLIERKKKSLAFVIAEMNQKPASRLFPRSAFFIPDWLNGEVDLESGLSCYLNRNNTIRSNMRKVRKAGFTYEIHKSETYLSFFYEKLYLPFISARHNEAACIRDFSDMKSEIEHGQLIFIKQGAEIVAGELISYRKGTPELKWMGILNGNLEHMKHGAITALYYFGLQYLRENGHRKVLLGCSRPFFSDGVLKYKRINWGAKVCDYDTRGVWFKPIVLNSVSRQFLLTNPFNTILGDKKKGIVFAEYEQLKSRTFLEKLKKQYLIDDISGLELFVFGMDSRRTVHEMFSANLLDGIRIRDADTLFWCRHQKPGKVKSAKGKIFPKCLSIRKEIMKRLSP